MIASGKHTVKVLKASKLNGVIFWNSNQTQVGNHCSQHIDNNFNSLYRTRNKLQRYGDALYKKRVSFHTNSTTVCLLVYKMATRDWQKRIQFYKTESWKIMEDVSTRGFQSCAGRLLRTF